MDNKVNTTDSKKYPFTDREKLREKYKNNMNIVTALANTLLGRPIEEVVDIFEKIGFSTYGLPYGKVGGYSYILPNMIKLYYVEDQQYTRKLEVQTPGAFCAWYYL